MGNQCDKAPPPETICGPNTMFDSELNKCTAPLPADFCKTGTTHSNGECIVRQDCQYGVFSDGKCVEADDVKGFNIE